MRIGVYANSSKRELLQNYFTAYKMLFRKHDLYAPETTARSIEECTGLYVNHYLHGTLGGISQLMGQIERNEMDAMIIFHDAEKALQVNNGLPNGSYVLDLVRLCDEYCIPVSTNLASAEVLILGIENGDLDWRL